MVLLDRWEGFTATLGELDGGAPHRGRSPGSCAEGASVGVHLVMTGDRSLLVGRISALCEDKLVFKLAEKDDYAAGRAATPRDLPDDIPPGRAFRAGSGTETAGGAARAGRVRAGPGRRAARDRRARPPPGTRRCRRAQRPFRVDVLPARMSFADAWRLRPAAAPARCGPWSAWAATTLAALGPDLAVGMPVLHRRPARPSPGGPRSCCPWPGRSWPPGTGLVVAAPRPSPLRSLAGRPGVAAVFTGSDLTAEELAAALSGSLGPASS